MTYRVNKWFFPLHFCVNCSFNSQNGVGQVRLLHLHFCQAKTDAKWPRVMSWSVKLCDLPFLLLKKSNCSSMWSHFLCHWFCANLVFMHSLLKEGQASTPAHILHFILHLFSFLQHFVYFCICLWILPWNSQLDFMLIVLHYLSSDDPFIRLRSWDRLCCL